MCGPACCVAAAVLLLVGIGAGFVLHTARVRMERERLAVEARSAAETVETLRGQVGVLSRRVREYSAIQHDQRHHLAVLRLLWQQGDYDRLGDYLGECQRQWSADSRGILCAHEVADAVLHRFAAVAREQDTALYINAEIPRRNCISDVDLCGVLSNLLENAVKATAQLPAQERQIYFTTRLRQNTLVILQRNRFAGKARRPGTGPAPRRRVGKAGVGLQSVRMVAEKYAGSAQFDVDGKTGEFVCLVQLPCKMAGDAATV